MKRLLGVIALLAGACAEGSLVLTLPALEPGQRSGLIFVQTGEGEGAPVREAHALDLDRVGAPLQLEAEAPEIARLLLYEEELETLGVNAGPLSRPAPGTGRALPAPSRTFVAALGDDVGWAATDPGRASMIPWDLPSISRPTACDRVRIQTWTLAALSLVQPLAMVVVSDDLVIIGGHRTESDGRTTTESLLVAVDGLAGEPRVRALGTPWPEDIVHSLVRFGPSSVLGSTEQGRVFRVDLDADERVESPSPFEPGRRWRLARGVDGTTVVYDATPPEMEEPSFATLPGYLLDGASLTSSPFSAPEPMSRLVIHDAGRMAGAASGRLYHWDGSDWRAEAEADRGLRVTRLAADASGTRFAALISETFVWSRSPNGTWESLPPVVGSFGLGEVIFLAEDELLAAGGAGVFGVWDGQAWCEPRARPFSRDFRALVRSPSGEHVFAVTYSEQVGQPVTLARLTFAGADD